MKFIAAAVVCAAIILTPLSAFADDFSNFSYVYDTANVIEDIVETEIYLNNDRLNQKCRAQIVVATINHTDEPLEDYCTSLFNRLGIGDSILNNGILLVLAIEDDDYYLSTGGDDTAGICRFYTKEDILTDFDYYLEPFFAKKEYSEGVKQMFKTLFERVKGYYNVDIPYYALESQ